MLTLSLICLGAVLGMMLALWIVSLLVRDASIVDMIWGVGFVLIAWIAYVFG